MQRIIEGNMYRMCIPMLYKLKDEFSSLKLATELRYRKYAVPTMILNKSYATRFSYGYFKNYKPMNLNTKNRSK